MGKIKGQLEHRKFKEGKSLTRKEAILAQCYVCNGEEAGSEDCQGMSCPSYINISHIRVKESAKAVVL